MPKLYVHIDPADRRIKLICEPCRISRIELTYNEALREARNHKAWHEQKRAA